jgi:hypothetical protein
VQIEYIYGKIPHLHRLTGTDIESHKVTSLNRVFEPDGEYYQIWQTIQRDDTLSAVVRSRRLHIYRNGKKVLVLAGKSQPKIIREDAIQKQLLNK